MRLMELMARLGAPMRFGDEGSDEEQEDEGWEEVNARDPRHARVEDDDESD
jgi:hypothetical protein